MGKAQASSAGDRPAIRESLIAIVTGDGSGVGEVTASTNQYRRGEWLPYDQSLGTANTSSTFTVRSAKGPNSLHHQPLQFRPQQSTLLYERRLGIGETIELNHGS